MSKSRNVSQFLEPSLKPRNSQNRPKLLSAALGKVSNHCACQVQGRKITIDSALLL